MRSSIFPFLLCSLLTACELVDERRHSPLGEAGAAQPTPLDQDAGTAQLPRPDGIALPDGTRVVSSSHLGGGCRGWVVEEPPRWSCSAEQIAAARGERTDLAAAPDSALQVAPLAPQSCAELAEKRRPVLKQMLHAQLEGLRRGALQPCLPSTRTIYAADDGGGRCYYGAQDAAVGIARSPQPETASSNGATHYSTTNTQVAEVDEADFVKNDSGYVYVLSESALHVIDAWPAAETHELTRVALPALPTRLFLHGDRLVVYLRDAPTADPRGIEPSSAQQCSYGYDCRFSAESGATSIVIYDVSAPATPRELTRYTLSGGYVTSRRVGNAVHTVVLDEGPSSVPGFVSSPLVGADPSAIDLEYERRRTELERAIAGLPADYFLPRLSARGAGQPEAAVSDCAQLLSASAADGSSFTSLVSFDLATLGTPTRSLIASRPGFVYASAEALYLAADGLGGAPFGRATIERGSQEKTTLHKFRLDGASARYAGSGQVAGHVLNQFSMDDREGVLRVATSLGRVPDPNVSSSITTFAEVEGKLSQLGAVTGIAPTEDIRSVRFDGDRGFIVTFKKTDPLFAIDLADPSAPRVLGELKIPGFSTYMQSLDRDHLLAVGFDADDQGSFAFFNGVQIQIFDVSDLSAPKLLHKTSIGTRGSASEGLTNHLAFNYFPAKGLLALPMTVCEGGGDGRAGDALTFSGLMVFDVSLTAGIKERGRMPFVDPSASGLRGGCSSWWTEGRSVVKRSIFMDDFAIGLSDSQYQVAPLANPSIPLKTLPLGTR